MIHALEFSNIGDLPEGLVFATAHTDSLSGRGDCRFVVPHETSEMMPLVILFHGVHGSHWSWPVLGHAGETLSRLVALYSARCTRLGRHSHRNGGRTSCCSSKSWSMVLTAAR